MWILLSFYGISRTVSTKIGCFDSSYKMVVILELFITYLTKEIILKRERQRVSVKKSNTTKGLKSKIKTYS